ncbi:MAG: hypothetical protein IJ859_09255 [Synergistaceae bacterium]|nr:hypothetical protein [Synergistaceae bacterium]
MPKARVLTHEERLAMTKGHSSLLQEIRESKDLPPAYPGAEEINEKNFNDANHCPVCGGELIRFEGCYRCKKCSWSKCG